MKQTVKEQYALYKMQIKEIEDKCKELVPEIMSELEGTQDMKIKENYGSFSVIKTTRYEFTDLTKKKIELLKLKEIESGKAKPTYNETLRFTPSKFGLPKGAYDFSKYDNKV